MIESPRKRLGQTLKSPYPDDEGTFWDALLSTIAAEVGELETTNDDVLSSKVIDDATGAQLDKLGELVNTERESGESDDHYRGRLKVQIRRFLSGATLDQIKETAAILLHTDAVGVAIEEDFDVEAGRFIIKVWQNDLDAAGVSDDEFRSFIDQVRGAGVRTVEQVRGTFTYRSEQQALDGTNDPTRGYSGRGENDDSYENGTYAGVL